MYQCKIAAMLFITMAISISVSCHKHEKRTGYPDNVNRILLHYEKHTPDTTEKLDMKRGALDVAFAESHLNHGTVIRLQTFESAMGEPTDKLLCKIDGSKSVVLLYYLETHDYSLIYTFSEEKPNGLYILKTMGRQPGRFIMPQ